MQQRTNQQLQHGDIKAITGFLQEMNQLKTLNKKLIDQNTELEEEVNSLKQKQRVNEIMLDTSDCSTNIMGKPPFYNLYSYL